MNELKAGDISLQDYNRFKVEKQEKLCAFFDYMLWLHNIKCKALTREITDRYDAMQRVGMIDGNKTIEGIDSQQLSKYRHGKLPVPFWAFYPACVLCNVDYMEVLAYYGFQKSMSETEMQAVIASQNRQIENMRNFSVPVSVRQKVSELFKGFPKVEMHRTPFVFKGSIPKIQLPPETRAALKECERVRKLAAGKNSNIN